MRCLSLEPTLHDDDRIVDSESFDSCSAAMSEQRMRTARVVSVIAATTISLACGTNVRYPI